MEMRDHEDMDSDTKFILPDDNGGDDRWVACDYCSIELELSADELVQGWFVCPECGELSHLGEPADALDASQEHGMRPWSQQKAECGHCRQVVNLSARQSKQGWFICPFCHELGQLDDYVTCLNCGSQLELTEEEWDQEQYRCPECEQVTRLADSDGTEAAAAVPEFAAGEHDADWVQLKTAVGPEEAALEVAFLRANGIEAHTWQQGAGRAYGLTVGPMGLSHIMVREDQFERALSLLESETEDSLLGGEPGDDAMSDTSKTVLGLAAVALNPIGAGLAIGASQLLGRNQVDEQTDLVKCGYCDETVSLSARQTEQGWFFCPHCHGLGELDDFVTCLSCGSQLELNEEEWDNGWYRCPECDQVTHLADSTAKESGPSTSSPADSAAYFVECAQCNTSLELSDQEVAQGHFICPECQWMIQLSNYVVCPVCQTQLVLDEAERKQGWYRCPECGEMTQL